MTTQAALEDAFAGVLPAGSTRYDYQIDVGLRLLAGRNLCLRAPTGCGKTLSAVVPFLVGRKHGLYGRMIYTVFT